MFIPDGVANNLLSFPCKNPDLIYQKTKVVEHTLLYLQTYYYIFSLNIFHWKKLSKQILHFIAPQTECVPKWLVSPALILDGGWGFAILFLRKISSRYFQKGFSQPLFGRTSKIDDTRRDENTIFCIKFLPNQEDHKHPNDTTIWANPW